MKLLNTTFTPIAVGACLLLGAGPSLADSLADNYPSSAITLVVPFAPGGGVDIVGRILAKSLTAELGKSVVVENKPGASGMIGAGAVAQSNPDGLTLLLASSGEVAINPHLYKSMTYSPEKDLAPITLIAKIPNLLTVDPRLPINNVSELVAYAKAHPNKLSYSSSGVGNIQNITGELLNSMAGTHILHVPYKGSAPAIADVAGGQVSMTFASGAASLPFISSGKIRPIGVTSSKPMKAFPDVPPIKASPELKDFELDNWFGFFTKAGTPEAIIKKLNAATVKALSDPDVVKALETQGAEPAPMTPQEFADFRNQQSRLFSDIIEKAHITVN